MPPSRHFQSSVVDNTARQNTPSAAASSCIEINRGKSTYHYELTILIPAYNEIDRIGSTLSTYISYLSQSRMHPPSDDNTVISSGTASILVVDDGSTDGTADFVRGKSYLESLSLQKHIGCWGLESDVKCISLAQNEGKGAAISKGMEAIASGFDNRSESAERIRKLVLVTDADGSGDMSSLCNMIQELETLLQPDDSNPDALVVGYRQCKDKSLLRSILSWGFRTAVSSIFIGASLRVCDTQCGFKLMPVSTGKKLYNKLNLQRWTHDVEVIYRARLLGIPVGECPVTWVDAEGSKLVTSTSKAIAVSLTMLKEIATMRVKYASREWDVV